MRTTRTWMMWMLLPLTPLATACGGDAGEGAGEDAGEESVQETAAVDPATAGTVVGRVTFDGTAPQPEAVDLSQEPACAERHPDGQLMKHPAVVGADNGLKWVFVRVSQGLPEANWGAPQESVTLDQDGCEYQPHVLGIQVDQTLAIENSDGILHNINANPEAQRGFNISQPTTMTTTRTFNQPEVMIPIRCDVHGWMEAYVGVQDHPYFAVTSDDGSYRIENLPAGDYVIETWHERYGTQTQNVTVAAQGEATADFTYSEAMAGAHVPMAEPIDLHAHASTGTAGPGD